MVRICFLPKRLLFWLSKGKGGKRGGKNKRMNKRIRNKFQPKLDSEREIFYFPHRYSTWLNWTPTWPKCWIDHCLNSELPIKRIWLNHLSMCVYLIIEEGIHNKTFSKNMGQSSPIRCKRATQVKLFNSQPRPINI